MHFNARAQKKFFNSGYTLIELMVVMAIIGIAAALVAIAIPASNERTLSREGDRLVALLEAARAQSRSAGVAVTWRITAGGFEFEGLPSQRTFEGTPWPSHWLDGNTQARLTNTGSNYLTLGPDPVIGPQSVVLFRNDQAIRMSVATDGLRPFTVERLP